MCYSSDAVSAGSMNIYVCDGSSWEEYPYMMGYNALQALQSTGLDIEADTDYIVDGAINSNYGDITRIGDDAETDRKVWNTIYYHNGAWAVGPDAIGFITPFLDRWHNSANVAFYYGTDLTDVPGHVDTYFSGKTLVDLIEPYTDEYAYNFYLKIKASGYTPVIAEGTEVLWFNEDIVDFEYVPLTCQMLTDGVDIRGYGSNAYATLRDAVGGDNVDDDPFILFGLSSCGLSVNDTHWVQNTGTGSYLKFPLGAYGTLDNVPRDTGYTFVESSFRLVYCTNLMEREPNQYDPTFGGLFGSSSEYYPTPTYTFTLSFDANGGSEAPSSLTYEGTELSYTITIPSVEPVRDGHLFSGWSTSASSDETEYSAGQTITVSADSTITLYAIWVHKLVFSSQPCFDGVYAYAL